MASHPPAQCCTVGVKHEGDSTGKRIKIADSIDAYVATPSPSNAHADTAILYLPDVLGIWKNSELMADQFAANGYLTVVLDLFNGDALTLNRKAGFDLAKWIAYGSSGDNPHTTEAVDAIVENGIKYLKEELKITKIGAVGYCFGAKYVIRHYKDGISVGFIAHPSFVDEEEVASIPGPLSIAAAQTDGIFPREKRFKTEEILETLGIPYQVTVYSGVSHGFSVRCDTSKKIEKFAKEQAFIQAVTWFDEHLI